MPFITLNCDKSIIYIIIYWIIEITYILMSWLKPGFFSIIKDGTQKEYIFSILLNFGDLLSGFLVLYIKHVSKSKRKQENIRDYSKDDLIYEEAKPILKKNFYIKILIISVLNYISRSLDWICFAFFVLINYNEKEISYHTRNDLATTVDIIIRYIIAIFILKNVIYRHNKLSILMIAIGLILIIITDFFMVSYLENKKSISVTMVYFSIYFLRGISLPFEHMLIKQLFSNNYILPHSMQFIRGIMEMIIIIILTIIFYFSFNIQLDFNIEAKIIISLIFYTLKGFITSYISLKIIYQFSIQSVSFLIISGTLGGSIKQIVDFTKYPDKSAGFIFLLFFEILGIVIILFATLIYDELIIINRWKLNENVKLHIIDRSEKEIEAINNAGELPL